MKLDEGYMYGLGVFETIAVENGSPILLDKHLDRLNSTLKFLQIDKNINPGYVEGEMSRHNTNKGVIKIMISQSNNMSVFRENPYKQDDYDRGFRLKYGDILRNDTSPFTYHKTFNYGECILEKRICIIKGYDEAVFVNTKNEICEGTSANIFFVKEGKVKTPEYSCGLLRGIIRNFLLENYDIEESIIVPGDVASYNECFITNSVMGIMPVCSLGDTVFSSNDTAAQMRKDYMSRFNI
jgi:4-amino-4-deoxychorismate lyase